MEAEKQQLGGQRVKTDDARIQELAQISGQNIAPGKSVSMEDLLRKPHISRRYASQISPLPDSNYNPSAQ